MLVDEQDQEKPDQGQGERDLYGDSAASHPDGDYFVHLMNTPVSRSFAIRVSELS